MRKVAIRRQHMLIRMPFFIIFLFPIIFFRDFHEHFLAHLTGSIRYEMITQQWLLVIINIIFFVTFLIPLSFRRKISWKESGLVTAFFISLFVEMYGIPLTVFIASGYFGHSVSEVPKAVVTINFFDTNIAMTLAMLYGIAIMLVGILFIVAGWITLYKNTQYSDIVTKGVYALMRHPQYLGFVMVILGWFIGWPTFLTLFFTPILLFVYLKLCIIEERELSQTSEYAAYKERVPFLL